MKNVGIPSNYDIRSFTSDQINVKEVEGKKFLHGLIPYNSESVPMMGVREVILPTAFTKSLSENKKIVALVDHDTTKVLGSLTNGTLVLRDEPEGLFVEVELNNTTFANDVYEIINRGDVTTMSFGFSPIITDTVDGVEYIKECKLYEVSFGVAMPAYENTTSIALTRNRFNAIKEKRSIDIEALSLILEKETIEEKDKELLRNIVTEIETIYTDKKEVIAETKEPVDTTLLESLRNLIDLKLN